VERSPSVWVIEDKHAADCEQLGSNDSGSIEAVSALRALQPETIAKVAMEATARRPSAAGTQRFAALP
jgi:hypothetical protein